MRKKLIFTKEEFQRRVRKTKEMMILYRITDLEEKKKMPEELANIKGCS
jgi:hypothetical protein